VNDEIDAIQHIGSIQRLDMVISRNYPYCSEEQVIQVREKVIEYVIRSFYEGYDLAFIKREGDQAILRILRLIEEENI
jgi:hypothetical protein